MADGEGSYNGRVCGVHPTVPPCRWYDVTEHSSEIPCTGLVWSCKQQWRTCIPEMAEGKEPPIPEQSRGRVVIVHLEERNVFEMFLDNVPRCK